MRDTYNIGKVEGQYWSWHQFNVGEGSAILSEYIWCTVVTRGQCKMSAIRRDPSQRITSIIITSRSGCWVSIQSMNSNLFQRMTSVFNLKVHNIESRLASLKTSSSCYKFILWPDFSITALNQELQKRLIIWLQLKLFHSLSCDIEEHPSKQRHIPLVQDQGANMEVSERCLHWCQWGWDLS